MRAARRTAEEQYQLILECRRSGMSDGDWCREKGIKLDTFYTWIGRLRKKTWFPIPPTTVTPAKAAADEIVKVDILPEESLCRSADDKNAFIPQPEFQTPGSSIEIATNGVTFRFSGKVDASLYEKTLLAIGGRL